MFDKLLLLSEGSTVYFGPSDDATVHFSRIGYICPPHYNPADYFLDLLSLDTRSEEREKETRQVIFSAARYWYEVNESGGFEDIPLDTPTNNSFSRGSNAVVVETKEADDQDEDARSDNTISATSSWQYCKDCDITGSTSKWFHDFSILFWRSFMELGRDWPTLFVRVATNLFFALILSLIYNLGHSQSSIQNRLGLLFFAVINQGYSYFLY